MLNRDDEQMAAMKSDVVGVAATPKANNEIHDSNL